MPYKPHTTQMIPDVFWVGANDWSIRIFHGYHTDEGSSYNSYLIMDEHPTLIDTVKYPFAQEHFERIQGVCDPSKIEYIVMNHAEGDHSSALPITIKSMPQATIVTNAKCKESLELLYPELKQHTKWQIVDGKSTLCIGKRTLSFLPVPMIHWPDSMFTYSKLDQTLFSNDGFGQHIASAERWADQLPLAHVMRLLKEYNANILGHLPTLLQNIIKTVCGLDIAYILCAHGVSWRGESICTLVEEYKRFAYRRYNKKVTIVFDSMYGSTQKVALAISEGVRSTGATCEVLDLKASDITKVALHLYDSAAFAFGSPTLNNCMMPLVEGAITYCRGLKLLEEKPCAVFGAFGWASRAVADLSEALTKAKAVVGDKIDWRFQVNDAVLERAFQAGVTLGNAANAYTPK